MPKERPPNLRLVPPLPESKTGARAPAGSESLGKLSQARRRAAQRGTSELRAARAEAQRDFSALVKKSGFKSETDALEAIEKATKENSLTPKLEKLREAGARLRTATSDLWKEQERLGDAYSKSNRGKALLRQATEEVEEKSSASRSAHVEEGAGKWAQSIGGNIKNNLFNSERHGGELAFNWLFTGLGCMLVVDGARRLLSKPPTMITQDANGNMIATQKQRTAGDIAWGIISLGLGGFNIYYSALSHQQPGRMF